MDDPSQDASLVQLFRKRNKDRKTEQGGVTTLMDMYFFPEAAAKELDHQGLRAVQTEKLNQLIVAMHASVVQRSHASLICHWAAVAQRSAIIVA